MNISRAIGGPLDTVKLSAGDEWDGRIKHPPGHRCVSSNPATLFYPGRYRWVGAWVWEDAEVHQHERYPNGAGGRSYY